MRSSIALAFVASVSAVLAQTLTVLTPASIVLCQPAAITYSGGTAPYYISVLPGGEVSATALETFPSADTTAAGSYTWDVNLAAGTSITLQIKDSTGALAYSGTLIIANNNDVSCLSSTASSAAATSAASSSKAATTAAAATTTAVASSVAASVSSAAASVTKAASSSLSAASSTSSAAAASTSKASSATSQAVNVLALVGAAFVAIAA